MMTFLRYIDILSKSTVSKYHLNNVATVSCQINKYLKVNQPAHNDHLTAKTRYVSLCMVFAYRFAYLHLTGYLL